MEILPLALFLVMLELTVGSFVSLFLLDLRGDSSRNFIVFQGVLYLVFAVLTLLAMNAFATPEIVHGFGLDEPWLRAQGPLVLLFTLLMLPWNVLLWSDPQPRGKRARVAVPPAVAADAHDMATYGDAADTSADEPDATPPFAGIARGVGRVGTPSQRGRRSLRFAVGALTSLTGLAALFCVAMAYRALAQSRLDGAFVVLAFVAGAIALGGVMTAMLLGHWYLNTPTASGKPLEFVTTLLLAALAAELAFTIFIGPNTSHALTTPTAQTAASATAPAIATATRAPAAGAATPVGQTDPNASITAQEHHQAPLGTTAMQVLQFLMGFLAPLLLGGVALYLARGRSFQSATGMLYLCVAFIFMGEVLARGLLLLPGL